MIVGLARPVAMTKERDAKTTKYEELYLSVKQHVGFANKELAYLNVKVVKVKLEQNTSMAKAKKFPLRVHCVPGSVKEAKKLL